MGNVAFLSKIIPSTPHPQPNGKESQITLEDHDLKEFLSDAVAQLESAVEFEEEDEIFAAAQRFLHKEEGKTSCLKHQNDTINDTADSSCSSCNKQAESDLFESKYNFSKKFVPLALDYRASFTSALEQVIDQHLPKESEFAPLDDRVLYDNRLPGTFLSSNGVVARIRVDDSSASSAVWDEDLVMDGWNGTSTGKVGVEDVRQVSGDLVVKVWERDLSLLKEGEHRTEL